MSINETGFDYLCKICRFSLDDNFDSFLLLLLFLFWQIYPQSLCQSIKTKIVQANVHLAKHKKLIVTNYQANETISFQKSDKEYLSDESTQATFSKISRYYYTDPSVRPWQGKKIDVESSEVTKKDEGTRTATQGGEWIFSSPQVNGHFHDDQALPTKALSTRPTRFAEPSLDAFPPRVSSSNFSSPNRTRERTREKTSSSDKGIVSKTDSSVYTMYTHRCCVYIAATPLAIP